jgi:hypothetical protein
MDDMEETRELFGATSEPIYDFANVPQRVHHLDSDVKLNIAQPGNREYKHGPRVNVFRHNPDETEAFTVKLDLDENEIRIVEGEFSGLLNIGQFERLIAYIKKYRVQLLNLWYKPGSDIYEFADEIKAMDNGVNLPLTR